MNQELQFRRANFQSKTLRSLPYKPIIMLDNARKLLIDDLKAARESASSFQIICARTAGQDPMSDKMRLS